MNDVMALDEGGNYRLCDDSTKKSVTMGGKGCREIVRSRVTSFMKDPFSFNGQIITGKVIFSIVLKRFLFAFYKYFPT